VDAPHPAPDTFYAVPELAAHYDAEGAGRLDLPFYLDLARRLAAERVVDIGAGTGLLCSLLVEQDHQVIGVEPQETMLAIARRQRRADVVTWVPGTAADLPAGWADLALMTGHVAQYFLDDRAWLEVLEQVHRVLRPGGRLAFEVRNAAREEWREWASARPRPTTGGTVRTEVHGEGDTVTHVDHWVQGGRKWTTSETLRFPSWRAVERGLAAAGFEVEDRWGDHGGAPVSPSSPEWVVLARAG
jgi:SAM-dependent methyltransferase